MIGAYSIAACSVTLPNVIKSQSLLVRHGIMTFKTTQYALTKTQPIIRDQYRSETHKGYSSMHAKRAVSTPGELEARVRMVADRT